MKNPSSYSTFHYFEGGTYMRYFAVNCNSLLKIVNLLKFYQNLGLFSSKSKGYIFWKLWILLFITILGHFDEIHNSTSFDSHSTDTKKFLTENVPVSFIFLTDTCICKAARWYENKFECRYIFYMFSQLSVIQNSKLHRFSTTTVVQNRKSKTPET